MEAVLITLGIVLFLAALTGPRLSMLGLDLPIVGGMSGRLLFAASGIVFILVASYGLRTAGPVQAGQTAPTPTAAVSFTVPVHGTAQGRAGNAQRFANCGGLQSLSSQRKADVNFINFTAADIGIYWINFGGIEVLYATLPPYSHLPMQSYVGHSWCIRDAVSRQQLGGVTLQSTSSAVPAGS